VDAEVLNVCPPSGSVPVGLVQWQPALLDHQAGLVTFWEDLGLDDDLVGLAWNVALNALPGRRSPSTLTTQRASEPASQPLRSVIADHSSSAFVSKRSSMRAVAVPSSARTVAMRELACAR
jgi:hypothetical protein